MGDRVVIMLPFRTILLPFYAFMGLLLFLFAWGYFSALLAQYGIPSYLAFFLGFYVSALSLILSPVNVVVHERRTKIAVPSVDVVYVLGIPYYIPTVRVVENKSRVAVNLGGAVVPVTLSLWLLTVVTNRGALPEALIVLSITSIVSYFASKAVPGVGVVMSPVIPPLVSIVVSLVVLGMNPYLVPAVSYLSSVLGSLIGADLLHLKDLERTNPPLLSIGGAGTFDGIFTSGLLSLFFSYFLLSVFL
ncbi:MAG: DUF1614 domain-containing protein [Sulfolobales archaeon]|nr:DUF1614 domain-containing protein [Sulfolobales archaeon]